MIDRTLRKLFNAKAPPPMIWEPQVHGRLYPDRPYFLTRVRHGMNMLPPELQATFRENEAQVLIGRHLKTMFNDFGISKIYKSKKTKFASGVYLPLLRFIVMPQSTPLGTFLEHLSLFNATKTTLHEIGHLFSNHVQHYDGKLSSEESYTEAYLADISKLSFLGLISLKMCGDAFLLYDLDSQKLREETIAELFAEIISDTNFISKYFPETVAFIEEKIEQTCTYYRAANPDFDPETYPKMEMAVA